MKIYLELCNNTYPNSAKLLIIYFQLKVPVQTQKYVTLQMELVHAQLAQETRQPQPQAALLQIRYAWMLVEDQHVFAIRMVMLVTVPQIHATPQQVCAAAAVPVVNVLQVQPLQFAYFLIQLAISIQLRVR